MQQDMDSGRGNWKQKYLNALHQYEEQGKQLNSSITQLRYGLSRISVAANGLDTTLDRQLVALRRELRSGANSQSLEIHVKSISTTLQSLDESKSKQNHIVIANIKKLIFLLREHDLPKGLQSRIKIIGSKLDITGADKHSGALLAKFVVVIKEFLLLVQMKGGPGAAQEKNSSEKSSGSLFGRLFTKSSSQTLDNDSAKEMIGCMQTILEHLPVPGELEEVATILGSRLSAGEQGEDCPSLLQELTDFIIQVYQNEQQQFGHFLKQVNQQLQDVQQHFSKAHDEEDEFLKHVMELDDSVRHEVTDIQQGLLNASCIEDVAEQMQKGLSTIIKCVDDYRIEEEERIKDHNEQNTKLEESLCTTENMADELRISLSKQRQRANRDPLTGLHNRTSYNERLEEEFSRWKRDGAAFVLAMADVDYFKNINDTYGHLAGDKVLKKIGALFIDLTRSTDFIARYGGEEFVFLIRHTPLESATNVVEKLRKAIEECQFHFRGKPVKITMSFGLTQFKPYDTTDEAFARADKALYEAKQNGRNQVIAKV